jgi:hypothetical protein
MMFDLILDVTNIVFATFLTIASNLSQDRFNRPAGTGYFPYDSRHFVPGYDRAVPPGQIHLTTQALLKLALMGFQPG